LHGKIARMTMSRRAALGALASLPFLIRESPAAAADAERRLRELARQSRGRLGVAMLDTQTGARVAHRGDERFPMCSTFKLAASAFVLARVDRGEERLDRRITYGQADLLEYAPVTREHVNEGSMSLADLCRAAVAVSDNTAANLILATFGGPAGLTKFLRSIGDTVTRLDRNEPSLNESKPGDVRDTASPLATVETLRKLLIGDALKPESRAQLNAWCEATTTGNARLRAGVPKDWRVGDKTGTGSFGSTNDIAILTPPGRKPILVAAYLTETKEPLDARERVLKQVGTIVGGLLDNG
jgi:beta-lactamase class A